MCILRLFRLSLYNIAPASPQAAMHVLQMLKWRMTAVRKNTSHGRPVGGNEEIQGRKKGICGHKLDNRGCQHQRSHVQVDYPGNIATLFMFSHLPGTNVGAVTRWDLLRKVSLYKFMVSFYFAKVTLYFNKLS